MRLRMLRREFLGLLGLIGCEDMLIPQHGMIGQTGRERLFFIIGDSTAVGSAVTGAGSIPSPPLSSGGEWYNGTFAALRSAGNTLTQYSPWCNFVTEYAANIPHTYPVICNRGVGGSTFHDFGGGNTNNWALAGDNWVPAIADAHAMERRFRRRIDTVFIMLGINDARLSTGSDHAAIDASIIDLLNRIGAEFYHTNVVMCQIGREDSPTASFTTDVTFVRSALKLSPISMASISSDRLIGLSSSRSLTFCEMSASTRKYW